MIERILSLVLEAETLSIVMAIIIVIFLVGELFLYSGIIEEKSRVMKILTFSVYKVMKEQENLQKRNELYKKIDKQLAINGILYSNLIKEEENSKQEITSKIEHLNKEYILNIKCNGIEKTNEPFTTKEELNSFLNENTIFRLGDFIER